MQPPRPVTKLALRLRQLVVLALVSLWLSPALANLGPRDMLEAATDKMFKTLEQEREAIHQRPNHLFEVVDRELVPYVDTEVMSRAVLGKHWRSASPEQRARFTEEFTTLLVRFYVSALLDDPNELDRLLDAANGLISFAPLQGGLDPRKTLVRAEVHVPDGPVVLVTFTLYQKGEEWKVYDVTVEGVSVVQTYRSNFATEIRQKGLDALIESLATRNEELLKQAKTQPLGNTAGQ